MEVNDYAEFNELVRGYGLTSRRHVIAATTADGALATAYENADTIDGVVLATGDRILIKNQGTGAENGVYTVNASGAPTRAYDFAIGQSVAGSVIDVQQGTTNGLTSWMNTNTIGSDVVGTDALTWAMNPAIVSLQQSYNNSSNPEIVLGSAGTAGLTLRDNSTPIAGNLFEVQNNAGGTTYFSVDANSMDSTVNFNISARINDPTGIVFSEQSSVPGGAPAAGDATLWVKNDAPNNLYYTDDAGTAHNLTPLTTKGDILVRNGSIETRLPAGTDGYFLKADSGAGTGLAWSDITASNQGAGGVGVFKQKNADEFEFRNINATSNKITVTLDGGNNEIDIDANATNIAAAIDLDDLNDVDTTGVGTDDILQFNGSNWVDVSISSLVTLQNAYTNTASQPEITVDATRGAVTIRDNGTPIGANLFEVQTNAPANVFEVDVSGATITGALSVTGDISDANSLVLDEQTTVSAPGAGKGTIWIKDDVPSNLYLTDDTGVEHNIKPVTTKGDLYTHNTTTTARLGVGTDGFILSADSAEATGLKWVSAGNGEANTASNVGTGGVGVFKQKTGVDLEFKKINSTSSTSGITIVDDTGNDEVDVRLAINSLTADATPDKDADYVATYDDSATAHKKVLLSNLPRTQHDRQIAYTASQTSTTSTGYTDLTSATLTTNNLGAVGTYIITFNCVASHSDDEENGFFQILVGGVAKTFTSFSFGEDQGSTDSHSVSVTWLETGVASGTVIKVQWKTDDDTLYAEERKLIIDGILDTDVV